MRTIVKNPNPIKQTVKASKRADKAVTTFERAANALDRASAEHLAALEKLDQEILDRAEANAEWLIEQHERLVELFNAEIENINVLVDLANSTESEAERTQAQADNLRSLIGV